MSELAGKSILVTGAAEGIGQALAADFVLGGASVVLVDINPAVQSVAADLGGNALALVGDIVDPECARRSALAALESFGRIDGLVNAAGLVVNGTAMTVSDIGWERAFAVNVTGTLHMIRAALPDMLERGCGSIVNFGSVVGIRGRQNGIAYVTSKAAVLGLTRSVALDFGRRGVRCNSISPGAIDTPMLRGFERTSPGAMAALADSSFVGRIGTVADMTALCSHLLSDRSGFMNGADVVVDGGSLASFGPPIPDPYGQQLLPQLSR